MVNDLFNYCTALQSQKAVSAYFTGKQILPFCFARRCTYYPNYKVKRYIIKILIKVFVNLPHVLARIPTNVVCY